MHTVRVALILMVQIAITITNKIYILQPLQRIDKALTIKKQMWQMSRNHLHICFLILNPTRFTIVKCMLHSC